MRSTNTWPGDKPAAKGSDPTLVQRIRDEIAASPDRRIPFARFMEMALTEPGLGYYVTSDTRPTRGGDFLTAPELHPIFGRCIGRLLTEVWVRMDSPPRFVVQEWAGAGGRWRVLRLPGSWLTARALRPQSIGRWSTYRPAPCWPTDRHWWAPSSPTSTSTRCRCTGWFVGATRSWSATSRVLATA